MRSLKILIVAGFCISLIACGSKPFSYVKPEVKHNAIVYIYRPDAKNPGWQPLSRKYPEVWLDGKSLGVLKHNRYIAIELEPGVHNLKFTGLTSEANWNMPELKRKFSVRHAEQKYFRFLIQYDPKTLGVLERTKYLQFLTPMSHDKAIYEIRELSLQD